MGKVWRQRTFSASSVRLHKEFTNSHSMAREIYNKLVVAQVEELRGHGPITALVELISCSDYFSKVQLVEGVVDCMFFMH